MGCEISGWRFLKFWFFYAAFYEKCGIIIDYYFLGASPDGKIIDFTLAGFKKFGLSSIKTWDIIVR